MKVEVTETMSVFKSYTFGSLILHICFLDLQADQVVSMSDFDLLELLNGQTSWSFDEDDEKVLDLLIAEGGDTFSI